jgi:predicted metal-dependent peptidase
MFFSNQPLTAAQRLDRAVTQVMQNHRYIAMAGVMMIGDLSVDETVPTACTNGRDVKFGPKFIDECSDAELRGVVIHETYHKLFRHLTHFEWMWNDDADVANRAWDYRINQQIIDENADGFATLPSCALLDERFRNMDEAQIYNILKQEKDQQQQPDLQQPDLQQPDLQQQQGQGNPSQQQQQRGFDEHDVEGANQLSEHEKQQLAQDIEEALRQGVMAASKSGTGSGNKLFDDLIAVHINWDDIMREFFTATCSGSDDATWRTLNRRAMAMGMLRPARFSERMDDLVVAIDTSGSTGQEEVTMFLSIVRSMLDSISVANIHVIYWDTSVCSHETYGEHAIPVTELVSSTKPVGGGGTDVTCVTQYLKDKGIKAQAVVVLTDGYLGGEWGQWSAPVLWGITSNKRAVPTVGKAINVTF